MKRNQGINGWKKSLGLLLATVLTAVTLMGCAKAGPSSGENAGKGSGELTKVTLNEVAHSIFYAPMYVAIVEGYFKEEGIDLTLVTGFGADKTMTAVLTGEADIGFMGSESTIYTYAGGAEDYVVNFAQLTQRAGNFLVSRTPVDNFSWDMLKGTTVLGGRAGGMPSHDVTWEHIRGIYEWTTRPACSCTVKKQATENKRQTASTILFRTKATKDQKTASYAHYAQCRLLRNPSHSYP